MTVKRITRRDFLRVSLVAGAGLSAASTGMLALAQDATQQAVPAKFAEAPMLADMVTAGTLPPVEQRLPKVPFVVGPGTLASAEFVDWQPGKYGGTIHTTNLNGTLQEIGIVLAMSILRAPDQSTTDPLPAIVSDYKVNADYTEFTLTIREGLKWSDGQPVTTNDVKFLWELYGDTRIFPTFPTVVRAQGAADGTPGKLTVTDDYTFSIAFDKPYGAFVAQLASWIPGYTMLFRPAHYLKTLHGDYTPVDKIQPILDKMKIDTWENLVIQQAFEHWNLTQPYAIGVPSLAPWIVEQSTTSLIRLTRNPYYWKVDNTGQQLPYVDFIEAPNTNDLQTMILNVAAGKYDVVTQYAQLKEMPLYTQNADSAHIKTVLTGSINNPSLLFLNHDFEYDKDGSAWQKLVSDPRFGSALAYAIDKDDVNKNLYFGLYDTDGITKETYDVDKSNALLDEIGMSKRDSDNFRTDPNGERFEFVITTAEIQPDFVGLGELLKGYFDAVGIRTTLNVVADDLFSQRMTANQTMATIHWSDGPMWAPMISIDYVPYWKGTWAPMSGQYWLSNGASGRKPPAYIQEFFDIHVARFAVPPGSSEGKAAYAKLEEWFASHYATIWPTGHIKKPEVFNADLGNVAKDNYTNDRELDYCMEQLYFQTQNN